MPIHPKMTFAKPSIPSNGVAVLLTNEDLAFGESAQGLTKKLKGLERSVKAAQYKGGFGKALDLITPEGVDLDRVLIMGIGKPKAADEINWMKLGGMIAGRLEQASEAHVFLDAPSEFMGPEAAMQMVAGMRLAMYKFDHYKTKKKDDEKGTKLEKLNLLLSDDTASKKLWKGYEGVLEGVDIARDLVNEPPNVIYPETFAERAEKLKDLGVEVEVLDDKALKKIGMRALLGVAQGSSKGSRVVIMRWNGAKNKDAAPLAVIGKGVTFDTGGISIKPAASMEDMKGDMAGAACVVGLMHALASRKAKANVVGLIGVVENMPDGDAQRPGDIVTSLSGQTIEIINTDAEGRLVLADVLWYAQERFKPSAMIDLATLTGAILVALGQEYAGLFSNNDVLSDNLFKAGNVTGERVWRLPLAPEYDKMVDSKFADVKNSAGRFAGSITAAHFLQRFVNDVPWAHLDIAGTGMAAPQTDTNKSWGSGWGVRLLDRLVADHYEGA